jgi:hypothetical protein
VHYITTSIIVKNKMGRDTRLPAIRSRFSPKSTCSWALGAVSKRTVAKFGRPRRQARRGDHPLHPPDSRLTSLPGQHPCTTTAFPSAVPENRSWAVAWSAVVSRAGQRRDPGPNPRDSAIIVGTLE